MFAPPERRNMPLPGEDEELAKIKLDAEIAIRRVRRMVEFVSLVCENERRILTGAVQNTGTEMGTSMHGPRIKINSPTMAIDRTGKTIHIPAGSEVRLIAEEPDSDQLVSVEWNGKTMSMFARDLAERGERLPDDRLSRSASSDP